MQGNQKNHRLLLMFLCQTPSYYFVFTLVYGLQKHLLVPGMLLDCERLAR